MHLSACRRVENINPIKSTLNDLQSHHEPIKRVDGAFKKVLDEEIMKMEERNSEKE